MPYPDEEPRCSRAGPASDKPRRCPSLRLLAYDAFLARMVFPQVVESLFVFFYYSSAAYAPLTVSTIPPSHVGPFHPARGVVLLGRSKTDKPCAGSPDGA